MICYKCGSIDTEEDRVVTYIFGYGPHPFILQNAPLRICRVCGPTMLPKDFSEITQAVSEGTLEPVNTRKVAVFDLRNPLARTDGKGDRLKPMIPTARR